MAAPEVDVGGCDIVQALMVSLVVVVVYEGCDLSFKITGQEVIFQKNAVLQGLMPALDLALGLRMIGCAAGMLHAFALQPFSQIPRDVTGAIVAEQTWFVDNMNLVAARGLQSQIECVCDVLARMFVQSFHAMM